MAERGWGNQDEVCQRSLCGPGRGVESRGLGNHLRCIAAGIRFYAEEGGAGNHPRRIAAGIRFYAEEGGAGNHPRRIAAGIRFYAKGGRSGKSSAIKRGHPRSWGKLAGGVSRGLSSAARERGHPRCDGAAGKGAERERWLLGTSSMGLRGCQGTRGWVAGPKEEARAGGRTVPYRSVTTGRFGWPCDSWDSFGPYPG